MELYNKLNSSQWEHIIGLEKTPRWIISFYVYHPIKNPPLFRDYLFIQLEDFQVLGRIYVAQEGINAQVSVPTIQYQPFLDFIQGISFLKKVRMNFAINHDHKSFLKLTIKVKNKIVADGLEIDQIDVSKKGEYLNAERFNQMLEHSNSVCVDIRNHYESEIGHFQSAIRPDVDTFRDSLPIIEKHLHPHKIDKNILMYCTGGIRCEKASAYLISKGFKNVYQLQGGIINYIREVQKNQLPNKFLGKNFVFDHRLSEMGSKQIISKCHQCGKPCDQHTNCANQACHLLFIQCPDCKAKYDNCCCKKCQNIIRLPAWEQKKLRKNQASCHKVFKKGRFREMVSS
ncbi:MAG: rhodanese-related sulfurtransferase [Flavobacteriaceae bacterium]|nr:rhodanese-related sulfurtransferase [Flavobacteriaceae bacterium]